MSEQQLLLFVVFGAVLGLLLWGRIRHDLVAAMGLFAAVILGLVPGEEAFSGFANPAVAIVALVLIASKALENSGALRLLMKALAKPGRTTGLHIAAMGGVGAALSSVINNVATLAMLMPLDIQAARKAGRPPALTLMPLSFATILGGMVTLIGTPPNIIAAGIRAEQLGEPYRMFDFAPVGLAVAFAGVAFISLLGWRLLARPKADDVHEPREEEFMAELVVPEGAKAVGKTLSDFEEEAAQADIAIVGLLHSGKRLVKRALFTTVAAGDAIVLEGPTDGIAAFIEALGLQAQETNAKGSAKKTSKTEDSEAKSLVSAFAADSQNALMEAVVPGGARIEGRSAASFRLRARFGVTLLGISHRGSMFREKVAAREVEAGDLLLLSGRRDALGHVADWLGILPVNEVGVAAGKAWRVVAATGLLAAAVAAASTGYLSFEVALAIAVAAYAAIGLVPAHEFYSEIDWPIVVLLACLLPLGDAFERVGATGMVANGLLSLTMDMPAVVSLVVLMVGTMMLSDVLNNVATIVIAGPLAVTTAQRLDVNPDTFLMGVTVAACCAFLTPIGHKNNMLILGPGGYRFGDYWRLGAPLELLVLAVGVPALLYFWPL